MVAEGGVDTDSLGRATWTFLHTLAATHPSKPTTKEQARLSRFMEDFSHVYPCAPCASSFRSVMQRLPPDTKTGPRFALWMCAAHNEVNRELGKDVFDCAQVALRWGVCDSCAAHQDTLSNFKTMFKGFAGIRKQSQ